MSRNPYERRRGPRQPGEMSAGNMRAAMEAMPILSGPPGPGIVAGEPRGLTIRELHAMVESAYHRGGVREREASAEEERNARREAWQEGHDVGERDAEQALLTSIDRQFGEGVRQLHRRIDAKLAGKGETSKAELLREAAGCLGALIEAHHRSFDEPHATAGQSFAEMVADMARGISPAVAPQDEDEAET